MSVFDSSVRSDSVFMGSNPSGQRLFSGEKYCSTLHPFNRKLALDLWIALAEWFTRKMGKSLALLGRLPAQLNVLSAIFCDKLGE
jgi:hypothetical protein